MQILKSEQLTEIAITFETEDQPKKAVLQKKNYSVFLPKTIFQRKSLKRACKLLRFRIKFWLKNAS